MAEKKIELTEIDPVEIFGVNDKLINRLNGYFPKLKVVARGNTITLKGSQKDISQFESSVEALPNELRDIARALLLKGETWDAVSEQMHISRSTLARYRNHAIKILSAIYDRYEKEEIERMLS